MKRTKFLSGALALALAVTSISVASVDGSVSAAAAKPKLNAKSKSIKVGEKFTLKVKKTKGVKKIVKTAWTPKKSKVVTLSKAGNTSVTIKGKAEGKQKITGKVTYKLKSSKKTVKLSCTVKVNGKGSEATSVPAATSPAATNQATTAPTSQATTAPTGQATAEPTATPEPSPNPYYNVSGYYASYDGSKSYKGKDNLYVNYVMADSKEVNKEAKAIEKLTFKIDSETSFEVGVYVNSWEKGVTETSSRSINASNQASAKVGSFTTNGEIGQEVSVDLSGEALDAITNERITFGFYIDPEKTAKELQRYCLHDMYAVYGGKSYPVSLSFNTVGCTGSAKGIYSTRGQDSSEIVSDKYVSLASLTEAKGYKFGTVVTYNTIQDKEFANLVKKHCDSITAANEFKAYSLLNQSACKESKDGMPAGMNWSQADAICEWAKENNLKIRGHALVWDQSMCQWFFNEGYEDNKTDDAGNVTNRVSADVMKQRLESYIEQVIMHFEEKYPGLIYCWDVVNEGLTDETDAGNGGDKAHYAIRTERSGEKNPFYEVLGYEYIKIAFQAARKTLTDHNITGIDLVYNDYNVFQTYNDKRNRVVKLVQYLNEEEHLCDTVGMQGYLGYGQQTNCLGDNLISGVKDTIVALSKAGVKVQLTEMAMRNFTNTEQYMDAHADFASRMFSMLADINTETDNAFTSMSLWAFVDDPTLNYMDDEYEYDIYTPYSGLFDETLAAKKSFQSIYKAFGGTWPEN